MLAILINNINNNISNESFDNNTNIGLLQQLSLKASFK